MKKLGLLILLLLNSILNASETPADDKPITIGVFSGSVLLNITPELLSKNTNEANFARFLMNSGLNFKIEEYSWLRALNKLNNKSDIVFYAVSRTPDREEKYTWVLPVFELEFFLFGQKETVNALKSLEQLKSGKFVLGCTQNSNVCEHLKQVGIPDDAVTEIVISSSSQLVKLINAGRIDFILDTEDGFRKNVSEANLNENLFQKSDLIHTSFVEYLTASNSISPAIVEKIRQAAKQQNYSSALSRIK